MALKNKKTDFCIFNSWIVRVLNFIGHSKKENMVYHLNRHFDRSKPNYSEHLLILTRMLPVLLSIGKPSRLSNLTRSRQDDNKKKLKRFESYSLSILVSKPKFWARLISFAPLKNFSRKNAEFYGEKFPSKLKYSEVFKVEI